MGQKLRINKKRLQRLTQHSLFGANIIFYIFNTKNPNSKTLKGLRIKKVKKKNSKTFLNFNIHDHQINKKEKTYQKPQKK